MQLLIFSEVNNHSFLFLCFVLCVPITKYFPNSVTAMKISEYFKPSTKRLVLFAYFSECPEEPPAAVQSVLWKQHPDSCFNFPSPSPEQPLHTEYHRVFFLGFLPSGGRRLPVASWGRGLGGKFLETLFVWKCFCSSLTFDW